MPKIHDSLGLQTQSVINVRFLYTERLLLTKEAYMKLVNFIVIKLVVGYSVRNVHTGLSVFLCDTLKQAAVIAYKLNA